MDILVDKDCSRPRITKVNSIQFDCDCDDGIRRNLNYKFKGGVVNEDGTSLEIDYHKKNAKVEFNLEAFTLEITECLEEGA